MQQVKAPLLPIRELSNKEINTVSGGNPFVSILLALLLAGCATMPKKHGHQK